MLGRSEGESGEKGGQQKSMCKSPRIGVLDPSHRYLRKKRHLRKKTLHPCSAPSFGYATNEGWPKHLLMAKAVPWNTW